MYQRIWIASLLMISVGCSQRASYRVVQPSPKQQAVALATAAAAPADATAVAHLRGLLFPVPGVHGTRVSDTFNDVRDGGARRHNAIDIMAPKGTPVISADDGRVLRLTRNMNGGISLYATNIEEQFVYYYAHLDGYHASIYAGRPLLRGDTIGYVGTTGNAPKDAPHLHFQVMRMPADRKFWNGEPINPYPLLRAASPPTAGR
jgi:murein DD-endopeptidase MepM/ murein hydrolase activator NlpD